MRSWIIAALAALLMASSAQACRTLEEGDQVTDEIGRVYRAAPSAKPFMRGEVALVETPESAAGALQDVRYFGCAGEYAYVWYRTFGGYAGIVAKDPDADLAEVHESVPAISVGCSKVDGPAPNYCTALVTSDNGRRTTFAFSIDRVLDRADIVCVGQSLEVGSTMQLRVDDLATHDATVTTPHGCFDAAASGAIMAEMAGGATVQVQVKRIGESGYQTIASETLALAEGLKLTDYLQAKTAAGR